MSFTNFSNGVSSKGIPQLGNGIPASFGTYYFVDYTNGSDTNDGLSIETAKKTVKAAYDLTVTNNNDVICLAANATHTLTAMLTVSKNRVHFVGLDGGGRMFGQRTRIQLGVTTAATDIGTIKVTGIGCTFRNIKFVNANTVAQGIYCLVDGGEYSVYENCEFYKSTDLDQTGASEVVANGDSSTFRNCTFGSIADAVSGDIIRACVRLTQGLAGTGKVCRDNYFENCLFWRSAGGTTTAFVYSANANDVERMCLFKGCTFYNSKIAAATPAQAVAGAATLTTGNILLQDCAAFNVTKVSTTTGVLVAGPAVNSGAGIGVNAA